MHMKKKITPRARNFFLDFRVCGRAKKLFFTGVFIFPMGNMGNMGKPRNH